MYRSTILATAFLGVCGAVQAQGLQAIRPLPGFECMSLKLTPEQIASPRTHVPVLAAPSTSAPVAWTAGSIVIVRAPQVPTNGFLEALSPGGQLGWIQIGYLRPWRNPYVPGRQCVPSMMSDGKPGFEFHS